MRNALSFEIIISRNAALSMNWGLLAYAFIGLLVSFFEARRKRNANVANGLFETIVAAAIWPLYLPLLYRYFRVRAVPSLDVRFRPLIEYIAELPKRSSVDENQLLLLMKSYHWLTEKPEDHKNCRLVDPKLLEGLEFCSPISLLDRCRNETESRNQALKNFIRQHGRAPYMATPNDLLISPYFEDSINPLRPDVGPLIALISKLASLTRHDAARFGVNSVLRSMIKMQGPLPCILLTDRSVLAIDFVGSRLVIMGILTKRSI